MLAETTQFYTQKAYFYTQKSTFFFPKRYFSFSKNRKKLPQISDLEWVGLS
jgi:hypothetical protein